MKIPIRLQPEFLGHLAVMTGNAMGCGVNRGVLETSAQWFLNPRVPIFLATVRVNDRIQCVSEGLVGIAFSPVMSQHVIHHIGKALPKAAEILMVRFTRHLSQCLQLTVNFQLLPPLTGGKIDAEGYSFTMPIDEYGNIQWLFLEGFLPPDLPPQAQVKEMIL